MGIKIAGYLPAPKDAKADYALMGKASDGTQVVVAECHHEDITSAESTQIPELDAILKEYGQMYSMLYDADGTDSPLYTYDDVERADAWGRENPYLVGGLSNYRQDLFSSDREIVALHWTLTCEPGVRKMPVQKPVTPIKPQPKPAKKQTKDTPQKTLKFPFEKTVNIDVKGVFVVDSIYEFADRYEFCRSEQIVYTLSKSKIANIKDNASSIFIRTK